MNKSPEIATENSKILIDNEKWPELTQKFKFECPRCDVVSDRKDRFKKHKKLSKGIETVKSCKYGCSFKSCTFIGLKNHKCLNFQDNDQQQFKSENQIINPEDQLALSEKPRNSLDNGIEFQSHMEAELTSNEPALTQKFKFECQKCDVVSDREDRFKTHKELSKGIVTV